MGDDIFVTNPEIIKRGIKEKAANSVLIKVNQIGTVSETVEAVKMAQSAGWGNGYFSIAAGKRKILLSPILPSGSAPVRLKPARFRARIGWRNTTS